MLDTNSLNGSSVRDTNGRSGRIVSVTETALNIAWMQKGLIAEEKAMERLALAEDLQILTLKEGWKSLKTVAGIVPPKVLSKNEALIQELNTIAEEAKKKVSYGKKKHSPFKNFGHLGPTTHVGNREVGKKTQWDCTKSGAYGQKCVLLKKDAKGRLRRTKTVKNIKIKPGYKSAYNHEYKQWRSKQGW